MQFVQACSACTSANQSFLAGSVFICDLVFLYPETVAVAFVPVSTNISVAAVMRFLRLWCMFKVYN